MEKELDAMDAIDALICFGYQIKKSGCGEGLFGYKLFVDHIEGKYMNSIKLLLEELKTTPVYKQKYYKDKLESLAI